MPSTSPGDGRRAAAAPPQEPPERLRAPLQIALVVTILTLALFGAKQASSPDLGFHLTAGNHILSGAGWPVTDPFTYTVNDHRYLDTSWGFQIVAALIERVAGSPGLVLAHATLVAVLLTLVSLTARITPGEVRVLLPLLLLGTLAAEVRFQVRPELTSYTLLALVLYLLHRHAEGRRAPLALLPPIFLVWVNTHSLFVLGWAALACFVVGVSWSRNRIDRPLLGWSGACVAVGAINPYGFEGLAFPLRLSTRMRPDNVFKESIGEFFSPLAYLRPEQIEFYLVPVTCYLVFTALVLVSLRSAWLERRFWSVLLALVFIPLSLAMIRNVPPLVVACLPGAVRGLSLERALARLGLCGPRHPWPRRLFLAATLAVVAVVGVRVVTDAYYISSRRLERFGLSWNRVALPLDAAEYARRAELRGRVLNDLNSGATLMWAAKRPVFIDGRLEVMGESFFEEYLRILASPAELTAAVRRHDIGWIVFQYRLRPDLLVGLSRAPQWRLVYVDPLVVIFARGADAARAHESVARWTRGETPPVDLSGVPGLSGTPRSGATSRWLAGLVRRQSYPAESFGRGVFHFYRGEGHRAIAAFADAIRSSDGAYYEMYNNLGAALRAVGHDAQARFCYEIYLDELPFYRTAQRTRAREHLEALGSRR